MGHSYCSSRPVRGRGRDWSLALTGLARAALPAWQPWVVRVGSGRVGKSVTEPASTPHVALWLCDLLRACVDQRHGCWTTGMKVNTDLRLGAPACPPSPASSALPQTERHLA